MDAPPSRPIPHADAPHARLARLLVVADEGDDCLVPANLSPVRVRTHFDALGAMTRAPEPFDWVVVRHGAGNGTRAGRDTTACRGADALRRLDPQVRLGLILADGAAPVSGATDHFDAVVHLPGETARLMELLDHGTLTEAVAAQESARLVSSPPPSPPPSLSRRDAAPPPPALSPEPPLHRPAPRPDPRPDPTLVATGPIAAAPASAEPLGDVDLVEAMLEGRAMAPVALATIAQQTGWSDLHLARVADLPGLDPVAAAVPVRRGTATFGWLVCRTASAAQLEPWASWLATWLGLEHRMQELRTFAHRDDLTGVYNRRFYKEFLSGILEQARALRRQITVMVFDIDNFKQFNDRFGHDAGDLVLIETVRLLSSVIRKADRVCRIGGDEFAVIFADMEAPRERGSSHPTTPEAITARFQRKIADMDFKALGPDAPGPLTISAGLATFPWDAATAEELLRLADRRALQSKRAGKNALTIGRSDEATERRSDGGKA